jgi:hypothetical protein
MNPEDTVIDAIDALVDWQLAHPEGDGVDDDDCPHCHGDWHGTSEWGCPGAFGTDAEIERFRADRDRAAAEETALFASWFGGTTPEEYRRGFGLVAGAAFTDTFNGEVGAAWAIPALDMNRVVWNVP